MEERESLEVSWAAALPVVRVPFAGENIEPTSLRHRRRTLKSKRPKSIVEKPGKLVQFIAVTEILSINLGLQYGTNAYCTRVKYQNRWTSGARAVTTVFSSNRLSSQFCKVYRRACSS